MKIYSDANSAMKKREKRERERRERREKTFLCWKILLLHVHISTHTRYITIYFIFFERPPNNSVFMFFFFFFYIHHSFITSICHGQSFAASVHNDGGTPITFAFSFKLNATRRNGSVIFTPLDPVGILPQGTV